MDKTEIFLLTKPPHDDLARLCLRLMGHSENAVLYLAGDGVYNLLETASLRVLPIKRILACKEDLDARGVQTGMRVIVPENFYELLVVDMFSEGSRIYAF
jgi:sulfur relay protein TusB/DsrH